MNIGEAAAWRSASPHDSCPSAYLGSRCIINKINRAVSVQSTVLQKEKFVI